MIDLLNLRHERLDDVPLLLGVARQLGLAEILNRHLGTHGSQRGLNNGQLAVGWLAFILSQADHRKSAVREWANDLPHTLERGLGASVREVDFSDDRLGNVARRLSDDDAWDKIEHDLWGASMTVFELPEFSVCLDGTTSYGFHQPHEDGLMQHGHSKDHRPDLAQLKLMAAVAEPSGQMIATQVNAGHAADDPLYTPLIERVRTITKHRGLLCRGDCKMAALNTRAELAAKGDYYLMPLPMAGETVALFERGLEAVVGGEQSATHNDAPFTWSERVLFIRSHTLAKQQYTSLEQRLAKATAALLKLTPPVARGQRQIREEATLTQAINTVLEQHEVQDLLAITWERQEHTRTHTEVRYVITNIARQEHAITARQHRFGWRVYVTNAPVEQLSLAQAVLHYRGGWTIERDFHLLKAQPLRLSPLFVWKDDQIMGLTRLLTLIESQIRHGQKQSAEELRGLYEGQPKRTTSRPTGTRLLKAFVRAPITLTCIATSAGAQWHVTPLSKLQLQILRLLRLPATLYAIMPVNSD